VTDETRKSREEGKDKNVTITIYIILYSVASVGNHLRKVLQSKPTWRQPTGTRYSGVDVVVLSFSRVKSLSRTQKCV